MGGSAGMIRLSQPIAAFRSTSPSIWRCILPAYSFANASRLQLHARHFSSKGFDICQGESIELPCLEKGGPNEETNQRGGKVLGPGMVLLKHYIPHESQVEVVKACRKLGVGRGGFYQPQFKNGSRMQLHMMCLGLDWDPETQEYTNRSIDNSEPPSIPSEFKSLVSKSIEDAHKLILANCDNVNKRNVEEILPPIVPDVCIVNFYKTSGRLGLHQDRDESKESLDGGLPVVSFSIGDTAVFVYSNQRYKGRTRKVKLESGDVLIFGGMSRHIFHGVASIVPRSAPKSLVDETGIRQGRLNLTFRQY